MDSDVVALVIHAVGFDARTQMWEVATTCRLQRVAGAAGRIDDDAIGQPLGGVLCETEVTQDARDVFFEGVGGRIFLLRDRVEFGLFDARAGLETVEPEVLWLERPTESRSDFGGDLWHQRRRQHVEKQLLDAFFGQGAVEFEAALDRRWHRRRKHIGGFCCVKLIEQLLIAVRR